jgi:Protein of unknown function (DUF2637)
MTSGEGLTSVLAGLRYAALTAIAVLVTTASLVSFAESYRGLYEWAARHGVTGIWVVIWPLMVDVFIAVGELSLFVALTDRWPARSRAGAWAVTLGGLAVSVSGNVGHVASHSPADRGTAAVPPLAAAFSLAVGMGVLKRVVQARAPVTAPPGPQTAPQQPPAAGPVLNGHTGPAARPVRGRPGSRSRLPAKPQAPVTVEAVAAHFAPQLAAGQVPSQTAIRRQWHVGSDRARELRKSLAAGLVTQPSD